MFRFSEIPRLEMFRFIAIHAVELSNQTIDFYKSVNLVQPETYFELLTESIGALCIRIVMFFSLKKINEKKTNQN